MPSHARETVLIADDDADTRAALSELLDDAGYRPLSAGNGFEALALLRQSVRPSAMLVDLEMPRMDGEALCHECLAEPALAAIPRVLVTGVKRGAMLVGSCRAYACIEKPVDTGSLLRTLRAAIDTASRGRASDAVSAHPVTPAELGEQLRAILRAADRPLRAEEILNRLPSRERLVGRGDGSAGYFASLDLVRAGLMRIGAEVQFIEAHIDTVVARATGSATVAPTRKFVPVYRLS